MVKYKEMEGCTAGRNRRKFTEEEIRILVKNPYTYRVTDTTIHFTLAFKEEFLRRYKEGLSPKQIVEELGHRVDMLGGWRVEGLRDHIVRESLSEIGLHEGTLHNKIKPTSRDYTMLPESRAIEYMRHELLYLRQKQVLSYVLSESLEVDFVLKTINYLVENFGVSLDCETLIHGGQGSHYTSVKFIQIVKDFGLCQSMSRRGNCRDNAPQESFFGHMKDEADLSGCDRFSDVCLVIDEWMDYCNNERYQWDLAKLSPNEFYDYCITGIYPLPSYEEERE